jgi:hypothetical protein
MVVQPRQQFWFPANTIDDECLTGINPRAVPRDLWSAFSDYNPTWIAGHSPSSMKGARDLPRRVTRPGGAQQPSA